MNDCFLEEAALIRKLSIGELETYLIDKGFTEAAAAKLKENEIDGWSLLKLQERHFAELGISMGQRIKLMEYITHLTSENPESVDDFPTFVVPEYNSSETTLNGCSSMIGCHSILKEQLTSTLRESDTGENDADIARQTAASGLVESSVASLRNGKNLSQIVKQFQLFQPQEALNVDVDLDVINILKNEPGGLRIVESYYGKPFPISVEDRQVIIRLTVQYMTKLIGHLYPSSEIKEKLAMKIVEAFPSLALNRPGLNPYSYLYNKGTTSGFIDTRLKTMRKSLPLNERKRRSCDNPQPKVRKLKHRMIDDGATGESPSNFDEADLEQKVIWLSENPTSVETEATIMEYMQDTFQYRKSQIDRELVNATMILDKYPRFIDFDNGRLIYADFLHRYPKAGHFGENFTQKYARKIFRLAAFYRMQIEDCRDNCLQALMLSLKLFPSVRKIKKIPLGSIVEHFIVFRPEDTDLDLFPKTKPPHLEQPFLLCLGSFSDPKHYYLIVDECAIPCGNECENAFQILIASFFTFGMEYPMFISQWYQFFEEAVFKIRETSCNNVASFTATLESLPQ